MAVWRDVPPGIPSYINDGDDWMPLQWPAGELRLGASFKTPLYLIRLLDAAHNLDAVGYAYSDGWSYEDLGLRWWSTRPERTMQVLAPAQAGYRYEWRALAQAGDRVPENAVLIGVRPAGLDSLFRGWRWWLGRMFGMDCGLYAAQVDRSDGDPTPGWYTPLDGIAETRSFFSVTDPTRFRVLCVVPDEAPAVSTTDPAATDASAAAPDIDARILTAAVRASIRRVVENHGLEFKHGCAFYQLTKPENIAAGKQVRLT